ncbi:MAG: hypothetical protein WCF95_02710 [bacterium]
MKPRIRELAVKAQTWKTLLSYTLAATAVGIAAQTPWEEFLVNKGNKKQALKKIIPDFFEILGRSVKEMWNGGAKQTKTAGVLGKIFLLGSAVMALSAPIASLSGFRSKHEHKSTVDDSKRYYEA